MELLCARQANEAARSPTFSFLDTLVCLFVSSQDGAVDFPGSKLWLHLPVGRCQGKKGQTAVLVLKREKGGTREVPFLGR